MTNTILIKKSSTVSDVPTAGQLEEGELAIATNPADRKLYSKDSGGTIFEIGGYVHPSHPGDDFSVDSGALSGATVISDIDINVTTDTEGHVTDANGVIQTRNLTAGDIGAAFEAGNSSQDFFVDVLRLANNEATDANLAGELAYDANDTSAPASLGTFDGSDPLGLYINDNSAVTNRIYHDGHFSGTHIANWQTAFGWGNHASAGYPSLSANELIIGDWTINDPQSNAQPLGYNTMPIYEIDVNDIFDTAHQGMIWHKDSGVAVTFTCNEVAGIDQGATWVVHNDDAENLTIAEGAGVTISFIEAGAAPVDGDVIVSLGGIVTVYKYTNTVYWVWGSKSSATAGIADGTTTDAVLRWNGSSWVQEPDTKVSSSGKITANRYEGSSLLVASDMDIQLIDNANIGSTQDLNFFVDTDNNGTNEFRWYANAVGTSGAKLLMELHDTGILLLDKNTDAGTTLQVKGGISGAFLAEFIRDQGADTRVSISGSAGEPQILFDRSNAANQWAIGVDTTNRFIISDGNVINTTDRFILTAAGALTGVTSYAGIASGDLTSKIAAETISGLYTFTNTSGIIIGDGNSADGDILINFDMDRPWTFQSQGNDASNRLVLKSINDKSFVITDTADATMFEFATGNGDFTAVGEVQGATLNASSDVRLKENLSPYIPKPLTFKAHTYDLKTGQKNKIGYLAQEVVKELPGAVSTDNDTGMLALDYNMVLVAKIAELEARLDAAGI